MKIRTHIFILFPEEKGLNVFDSLKKINNVYEFFSYEYFDIVYDLRNINKFIELNPPSKARKKFFYKYKNAILKKIIEREELKNDFTKTYMYRIGKDICTKTILKEAAHLIAFSEEDSYTICDLSTTKSFTTNITITESDGKIARKKGTTIHQPNIEDLYKWFISSRIPQWEYVWNEKHGEKQEKGHYDSGRKGSWVSPLMSDRNHAKELLPKAVGISQLGKLHIFDRQYNHYMEYQNGNSPKDDTIKYHSYHLDRPEDESNIDKDVIKKLRILGLDK